MTQGSDPSVGLERKLEDLTEALARLEARVRHLEAGSPAPQPPGRALDLEDEAPAPIFPAGAWGPPGTALGLVGRVCLILGGAFLIRAITDSRVLPALAGVALGVLYAVTWAGVADRAGRRGRVLEATVFVLTSAFILFPLTVESTLKLGALSPPAAAVLILGATVLLVAVTWRRDLHATTWAVVLVALGTGLVLMAATASLRTFVGCFLALGAGSLWLTYGRRWHGLRWPVALAVNGSVLLMDLLAAWPGGPPEAYRDLSPAPVILLSLALVLVYLGSFMGRTLHQDRAVNPFEVTQTTAVLLIGFGGAVRVAQASGHGAALLGAAALPVGLACYLVAFRFVARQSQARGNFRFFSSLALVFVLGGCLLALPAGPMTLTVLALALLAAGLGLSTRHATLLSHSGLFLLTAALTSGLVGRSLEAFLVRDGLQALGFGLRDLGLLVVLLGVHALMVRGGSGTLPWFQRLGSLAAGGLGILALAALAVVGASRFLPGPSPDPGDLAALRTAVLSLLVLLLALLARGVASSELRWLVGPLLGLTALKILAEDLGRGRPLTLFLAFTCFGTALTLAPILLKARRADSEPPALPPA